MKRLWFAVIFLSVCVGLCVFEQCYINNIHSSIQAGIEEIEGYINDGNTKQADKAIKSLQEYWKTHNNLVFTMSEHRTLDEMGAKIRSLEADSENIKSTLDDARALNEVFYENQKTTFANIF